jgi:hypothetical protein
LGEKSIKCGQEILKLLDAVWAPKWVAVMHCQGHQKGETTIVWGKWKANRKAKQAYLTGGQTSASLMVVFSCVLYLNETHCTHHKNSLGLKLKEDVFCKAGGKNSPMVT